MLNCKKVSYLASKNLDDKLTWREHIGLWLHISICSLCRRYVRDIRKLHALMRTAGKNEQPFVPESVKLSKKSRERINLAFNKSLHQSK